MHVAWYSDHYLYRHFSWHNPVAKNKAGTMVSTPARLAHGYPQDWFYKISQFTNIFLLTFCFARSLFLLEVVTYRCTLYVQFLNLDVNGFFGVHTKRWIYANLFYIDFCQKRLSSTLFMLLTYSRILFSSIFYFFFSVKNY